MPTPRSPASASFVPRVADRIRAGTDEVVTQTLQSAPLQHLRPYLARGARLGGLANSDYRTVHDIHTVPARLLTQVPGVDIEAAQSVQAAAQAMADHIRTTTRPRLRAGQGHRAADLPADAGSGRRAGQTTAPADAAATQPHRVRSAARIGARVAGPHRRCPPLRGRRMGALSHRPPAQSTSY